MHDPTGPDLHVALHGLDRVTQDIDDLEALAAGLNPELQSIFTALRDRVADVFQQLLQVFDEASSQVMKADPEAIAEAMDLVSGLVAGVVSAADRLRDDLASDEARDEVTRKLGGLYEGTSNLQSGLLSALGPIIRRIDK